MGEVTKDQFAYLLMITFGIGYKLQATVQAVLEILITFFQEGNKSRVD